MVITCLRVCYLYCCCICCSFAVAITDWHRKVNGRIDVIAIHFRRCDIAVAAMVAMQRKRARRAKLMPLSRNQLRWHCSLFTHTYIFLIYTISLIFLIKKKKGNNKRKVLQWIHILPNAPLGAYSPVLCDKIKFFASNESEMAVFAAVFIC